MCYCRWLFVLRLSCYFCFVFFFFQAEDGIRDLVRSRGLGDVYKRQPYERGKLLRGAGVLLAGALLVVAPVMFWDSLRWACLLYTSDAADERSSVDLGGRRIIKKKRAIESAMSWIVEHHKCTTI